MFMKVVEHELFITVKYHQLSITQFRRFVYTYRKSANNRPAWISAPLKGGSRHKNRCMARALSFLIRYFSTCYTLHRCTSRSALAPNPPNERYKRFCKIEEMCVITAKGDKFLMIWWQNRWRCQHTSVLALWVRSLSLSLLRLSQGYFLLWIAR